MERFWRPSSPQEVTSARDKPTESVPEQVKLGADMGADLDESRVTPVSTSGPNGDVDLYFDGNYSASNRSGLFYYYGTEQEAKAQCPKIVPEGKGKVPGPEVLFDNSGYIVLNYKLFT
ncbi:hypothetical protein [Amycolatopsis sp. lyj-108]|uniref:hypothetical protein n=1 Tax=Amycolatopsis sp. lyj-108 TaxID=2789286 RepID=UPI003978B91B